MKTFSPGKSKVLLRDYLRRNSRERHILAVIRVTWMLGISIARPPSSTVTHLSPVDSNISNCAKYSLKLRPSSATDAKSPA